MTYRTSDHPHTLRTSPHARLAIVLLLGACESGGSAPAGEGSVVLPDPGDPADSTVTPEVTPPAVPAEIEYVTIPRPMGLSYSCIPDFPRIHFWTTHDRQIEFRWGDLRGFTAERVRGGEVCGGSTVAAYVAGPVVDTLAGEIPSLELRVNGEWEELGLNVSAATAYGTILFVDHHASSGVGFNESWGVWLNPLHPDTRMVAVTRAWADTEWESLEVIAFTTPDGRVWASPEAAEDCHSLRTAMPIVSTGNTMEGMTYEIMLTWDETVARLQSIWRNDHTPRVHPLESWGFNEATGWWYGDIYCGSYRCCYPEPEGSTPNDPARPVACSAHADCVAPDEVCARLPGRAATCVDVAVLGPCDSDDDCEASQRETCTELPSGASVCAPEGLLVDR